MPHRLFTAIDLPDAVRRRLARRGTHVCREWTAAFLDRHAGLATPGIPVEAFRLCESMRTPRQPGSIH